MSLTLKYAAKTTIPVEIEGIVPERLGSASLTEIEKLSIQHGNRKLALAELFRVSGDPSDGRIDLEGDLSVVHFIGYGMGQGTIHVHGNAGRHLGGEMRGGQITVGGNVGDYVGAEMRGGLIHIAGTAGNLAGAAYPGSKRGMTDGVILIDGDVGNEAGAFMRRGTLAAKGSCGAGVGFNMIAGSILVFGSCGARPGAGMRRGTIAVFGKDTPTLLPTFRSAGRFRPLFLRLFFGELARLAFPVDEAPIGEELSLWHGDLVSLGKGEIWTRTSWDH